MRIENAAAAAAASSRERERETCIRSSRDANATCARLREIAAAWLEGRSAGTGNALRFEVAREAGSAEPTLRP